MNLPISQAIKARPVYARFLQRMHFMPLDPPTEEEKSDAILVMKTLYPPLLELDEVLLAEAERIFNEASA